MLPANVTGNHLIEPFNKELTYKRFPTQGVVREISLHYVCNYILNDYFFQCLDCSYCAKLPRDAYSTTRPIIFEEESPRNSGMFFARCVLPGNCPLHPRKILVSP